MPWPIGTVIWDSFLTCKSTLQSPAHPELTRWTGDETANQPQIHLTLLLSEILYFLLNRNELPRDKTNKMVYAPSEDSDQPGHLPGLIRVFAVRMKKVWVLRWVQSSFCWFSLEVAQIRMTKWLLVDVAVRSECFINTKWSKLFREVNVFKTEIVILCSEWRNGLLL